MSNKPWWWPQMATEETTKRLRNEYPEISADFVDDESFMEYFEYTHGEYMDTWDHLGDARSEYQKLASAFMSLVDECGKTPEDFIVKED